MSQRNCLSFLKCSNLEAKNVIHFKHFYQKERKGRTMISKKQNFKNESFKIGFSHLKINAIETFKLEIKLTKTKFKNQFYTSSAVSLQLPKAV